MCVYKCDSFAYAAVTYKKFACLCLNRIIPESVPWLIAKNRIDEAKEIVQSAATSNNIELPKKYRLDQKNISSAVYSIDTDEKVALGESGSEMTTKQTTEAESQECTLLDVMSSRTLRLYSAALFYLWYVAHTHVYYAHTHARTHTRTHTHTHTRTHMHTHERACVISYYV